MIPADRTGGSCSLRGEIVREINQIVFKRTGERRSFRITSAPMRKGDRIHSVVVVLTDVTEEVAFDRLKRDVLAALAHEFKTPVAIVKGYAQYGRRGVRRRLARQAVRIRRTGGDRAQVRGASSTMTHLLIYHFVLWVGGSWLVVRG